MARKELNIANLDHEGIKSRLIDFMKSTEFNDFNYEGSAINTIIDLLTRDSTYTAFLANMLANESFIGTAQVRANVSAHAQKLSYTPKTITATRMICDLEVVPADTTDLDLNIIMPAGTTYISAVGGRTYTFVNIYPYTLSFDATTQSYRVSDVELVQGQRVTNKFVHSFGQRHQIPNTGCDSSTILLNVIENGQVNSMTTFAEASSIDELGKTSNVWFRGENTRGYTEIEFGRDTLGKEPADGAIIEVTYVIAEEDFANGASTLIATSSIDDFTDILVTVTTPGFGGSPKTDIETIRFMAPKAYQMQDRALTDSDYIPLLKSRFSFIRSGISWGGEKNIPAAYGNVFISLLTEDGNLITSGIKDQMVEFVSSRNVGSITPIIVDPEIFMVDLNLAYSYDERFTNMSRSQLDTAIIAKSTEYSNTINNFGSFYNQSALVAMIKQISGVESVTISKKVSRNITSLRFPNPVYKVRFANKVKKGSVSMTGFMINFSGSNHKLYDRDGSIFTSYILAGETVEQNIGTVDYNIGEIEFSANFIQTEPILKLTIVPDEDNYYVTQNKVVQISSIKPELLNVVRR